MVIMYPNLNTGAIGVRASLEEQINFARKYGFKGIDFSISEAAALAAAHDVGYVKALFDKAGVMPGSWGFPVEYRKDEAEWRDGMEKLPDYAKLAHELGCHRTATWILPADDNRDFSANFQFHVDRLGPAAKILKEYGHRFGLEFIGPITLRQGKKYPFIHTLEGMRGLAAAMGTGNAGILLDVWHLYTAHGQLDDVREMKQEEIVVVHVNDAPAGLAINEQLDNVRLLPGESGVIDITSFLKTLADLGYDGPVTVEPFSQRVRDLAPDAAVGETYASLQKVYGAARLPL